MYFIQISPYLSGLLLCIEDIFIQENNPFIKNMMLSTLLHIKIIPKSKTILYLTIL